MAFVVREPTRKVHITRLLGTNKAGDVLDEIWLDVERFEQYAKVTQSYPANQYQQTITKFRWHDDPDDGDEYKPEDDKGTARNTVVLKVCSPDDDFEDPEEWVPVRVIKAVHLTHGDDVGSDTNQKYITEDLTAERKVKMRRVLHTDTSIDDKAEAAFEADPERRAYVAKSADYKKDDATKDDSQYIECEIVTSITKQISAHPLSNGTDQQVIKHLKNQYLLDETEEALLEELGTNDKNPPYRLDPFQNIVNVQWSTGEEAVLGNGDDTLKSSQKGTTWDVFKANSVMAATGLGKTVVGSGFNMVVFGKPRDGLACFITVGQYGTEVRRGVLDDVGDLQWSTVRTLPSGAQSLSFAGEAFFVSHQDDSGNNLIITSSFDGETFAAGENPFPGASGHSDPDGIAGDQPVNPAGGSVAYDSKNERWVVTGIFNRWYIAQETIHFDEEDVTTDYVMSDQNFMSAVSTDGTSWTGQHYDTSESDGTNNTVTAPANKWGAGDTATTVCFGKGLFVAASGFKTQHDVGDEDTTHTTGIPACGVATSSNGSTWNNQRLPDAQAYFEGGVHGGQTACVGFFKTGGSDADGYKNGFFLAGGLEFNAVDPVTLGFKLWRSLDGTSWEQVVMPNSTRYWALSAVKKNADPDEATII